MHCSKIDWVMGSVWSFRAYVDQSGITKSFVRQTVGFLNR